MQLRRLALLLVVVVVDLAGTDAHAGRALVEPKGWRESAARAAPSVVDEAVAAAGFSEGCAGASSTTAAANDVAGLGCRLAITAQLLNRRPLGTPKDVEVLRAFAVDVDAAALSVAGYEPLVPAPGAARRRFEAHRAACRALLDVHDRLAVAATPRAPMPRAPISARATAALAALTPGVPLKDAACGCVQQSLGLSRAGDAALEEIGALQSVLTSRGCFLDETKLRAERSPAGGVPIEAVDVAAANGDEARVAEYARARDVGLGRCRESSMASGRVQDKAKLQRCVCGEIARWQFPARKGRPPLAVTLPIGLVGVEDRLVVDVLVDAAGAPARCGPLAGPALPTTGS